MSQNQGQMLTKLPNIEETSTLIEATKHNPARREPIDSLKKLYQGPTDISNWIIPQLVMAGGYPRGRAKQLLVDMGCKLFVCLCEKPEMQRFGDYVEKVNEKTKNITFEVIHHPIRDRDITTDKNILALVDTIHKYLLSWMNTSATTTSSSSSSSYIQQKLANNSKTSPFVYIHCAGGHGRTGVVVSLLLAKLFQIDATACLQYCQLFHDCRIDPNGMLSPSESVQRNQVFRLVPKLHSTIDGNSN